MEIGQLDLDSHHNEDNHKDKLLIQDNNNTIDETEIIENLQQLLIENKHHLGWLGDSGDPT